MQRGHLASLQVRRRLKSQILERSTWSFHLVSTIRTVSTNKFLHSQSRAVNQMSTRVDNLEASIQDIINVAFLLLLQLLPPITSLGSSGSTASTGSRQLIPGYPSPTEMCLGQVQGPVEMSSVTTGVLAHPRPSSSMWYHQTDWTVTHPSGVKQGGTGRYHPVGGVGHLVIRNKLTMGLSNLPNFFHGWTIHLHTNVSGKT